MGSGGGERVRAEGAGKATTLVGIEPLRIGTRKVGPGEPVFIIAEAGVNHNGEVAVARHLVRAAREAGADAVKFQTFKVEHLVSQTAPKAMYQKVGTDPAETQLEMLRRLELSPEAHRGLQVSCQEQGILFLSTPFDPESADLLEELGVPAFKLGSGDLTNWPLLEHIAPKKRPIVVSTGMSELSEVEGAVRVIRAAGNEQIALLHCVSSYPADPAEVNLRAMQTMAAAFHVPVGFSDHTPGIEVALAAVALGACIIEKHLTLDRHLPGPDHRISLEPGEFRQLVAQIRRVEASLGDGRKAATRSEAEIRHVVRRSLAAACEIPAETVLRKELLMSLRPASGIPPNAIKNVIGRRVKNSMRPGQLVEWSNLE